MMKKILNKKFITIAIVSVVFFTAIIYLLLNGVDLKNLLSDVNSASNYKTADWSAPNPHSFWHDWIKSDKT